jgi:hypothetical protein
MGIGKFLKHSPFMFNSQQILKGPKGVKQEIEMNFLSLLRAQIIGIGDTEDLERSSANAIYNAIPRMIRHLTISEDQLYDFFKDALRSQEEIRRTVYVRSIVQQQSLAQMLKAQGKRKGRKQPNLAAMMQQMTSTRPRMPNRFNLFTGYERSILSKMMRRMFRFSNLPKADFIHAMIEGTGSKLLDLDRARMSHQRKVIQTLNTVTTKRLKQIRTSVKRANETDEVKEHEKIPIPLRKKDVTEKMVNLWEVQREDPLKEYVGELTEIFGIYLQEVVSLYHVSNNKIISNHKAVLRCYIIAEFQSHCSKTGLHYHKGIAKKGFASSDTERDELSLTVVDLIKDLADTQKRAYALKKKLNKFAAQVKGWQKYASGLPRKRWNEKLTSEILSKYTTSSEDLRICLHLQEIVKSISNNFGVASDMMYIYTQAILGWESTVRITDLVTLSKTKVEKALLVKTARKDRTQVGTGTTLSYYDACGGIIVLITQVEYSIRFSALDV